MGGNEISENPTYVGIPYRKTMMLRCVLLFDLPPSFGRSEEGTKRDARVSFAASADTLYSLKYPAQTHRANDGQVRLEEWLRSFLLFCLEGEIRKTGRILSKSSSCGAKKLDLNSLMTDKTPPKKIWSRNYHKVKRRLG
uniref:Uncharacterized protein n=1 Tax=Anopheles culicifacies TaxID=139723 RepID=A0A182LRV7_9DIPT